MKITVPHNKKTISTGKALIMYFVVSLFLFFEMAVQVSPSVMSTQLMQALNIGTLGLGFMSGGYFYTYTLMQIPSGILLDRFNPRYVIVISVLICALGCLLLGLANSFILASLARLFMGFGSAFAFVSVLVVTADLFSVKQFATMTGITQMLAALGAMSGQLPIHFIVDSIGWRRTMFLFAIIGLLIALGIYYILRYERKEVDVTHKDPFSHFIHNLKRIVTNRQTWLLALYACLGWAPMSGFTSLWGVSFLIKVDQLSPGTAAFLCSLMWIGLAIASPLLGYVSTRFHNRKLPLVLSALIGVIAFSLLLFFKLSPVYLAILLFLAGSACSGQALSFTLVKENNTADVAASAIAFNNMAVVISGAIFQPFIGWLLKEFHFLSLLRYRYALLVVLLAYAVAFILALFFIKDTLKYRANQAVRG